MDVDERNRIEAACTRLINLYAHLNDAGRWEDLAALYAEDGRFFRPTAPDAPIVGRQAILEAFRARPPRVTRHVTAGVVVTIESATTASATSVMLLFAGSADGDGLPLLDPASPIVGHFDDRLVCVDAVWRFAERRGGVDFRRR